MDLKCSLNCRQMQKNQPKHVFDTTDGTTYVNKTLVQAQNAEKPSREFKRDSKTPCAAHASTLQPKNHEIAIWYQEQKHRKTNVVY